MSGSSVSKAIRIAVVHCEAIDGQEGGSTKTAGQKHATKRELVDTGTDKRFVRRARGSLRSADVGRALTADRRTKAKTKVKSAQGDKGDR